MLAPPQCAEATQIHSHIPHTHEKTYPQTAAPANPTTQNQLDQTRTDTILYASCTNRTAACQPAGQMRSWRKHSVCSNLQCRAGGYPCRHKQNKPQDEMENDMRCVDCMPRGFMRPDSGVQSKSSQRGGSLQHDSDIKRRFMLRSEQEILQRDMRRNPQCASKGYLPR